MPRPREPFADALRTAREIVGAEAGTLVAAAGHDPRAYDDACHALALRIAQAIVDAADAGGRRDAEAA